MKARHFQWVELVIDSDMPPNAKYLCLYLATFMNSKQDTAWPGLKRMEQETGLTKKTVIKYLKTAQSAGYLQVESGGVSEGGGVKILHSNRYTCAIPSGVNEGGGWCSSYTRVVEDVHQGVVEDVHPNKQVRIDKGIGANAQSRKRRSRFTPPTTTQVSAYCKERGSNVDPQHFHDYYEARGWKLRGGQPMKSWQAAVRTWERVDKKQEVSDWRKNPDFVGMI